jgi:large subunit ribosomal protein L32
MAVPKRRQSNQKTGSRRAHDFLTPKQYSFCPNCGKAALQHAVCESCGAYKGRVVVKAEE